MAYAHSRNAHGQRHDLVSHLRGVSDLAAAFAGAFGAADLGRLLGLWHDVGKFHPEFQAYLLASEANPALRRHGPDHKAAGASLAKQHAGLLALAVQGHHGGLRAHVDVQAWLAERLKSGMPQEAIKLARQIALPLEPAGRLSLPPHVLRDPTSFEVFLRMVFSALVDADFLDTERHARDDVSILRDSATTLETLWQRFQADQEARFGKPDDTVVARVRREIYDACLAAADGPPGLYRLSVPTGGGKTRSAMAFALRHALKHGLRRVVVAVPFISITEQTADTYRGIFGDDGDHSVVLEHHSGVVAADDDELDASPAWMRLAAENWAAPVVVTTTVQLFESLFANSTSRTRRLHNLARSVIILDEAQALPSHLLAPILDVVQGLCEHYGTTVVLSTATQPAFEAIPIFARADAREIVPEPARYFQALKRVEYEWRIDPPLSWSEVAEIFGGERQALVVVNTKRDAFALLDALDDPDALHLSTLLCGAHRRQVIAEVRRRLKAGEPCRLASTQVIEAGVDLDFPVVLRALGPLDSIIQAAGRCNREGRLRSGRVIVFKPEDGGMPGASYRIATGVTGSILGSGSPDPDDPSVPRTYFRRLFETLGPSGTDREEIQKLRASLDYPEVARRFRMIDDATESVVVPYGTDEEQAAVADTLDRLRRGDPAIRTLLRRLQPRVVSVRSHEAERYRRHGYLEDVLPGLGVWLGRYDPVRGLMAEDPDPDQLVV